MIDQVLGQHPAVERFGLQDDVDQIMCDLAKLYNKLGDEEDV